MVTVVDRGGLGYAATSDLSKAGIADALDRARGYAKLTAGRSVMDYGAVEMPSPRGEYRSPVGRDPSKLSRREKYELLAAEAPGVVWELERRGVKFDRDPDEARADLQGRKVGPHVPIAAGLNWNTLANCASDCRSAASACRVHCR